MARRGSYAKGIAKREEILSTALDVIARNGYRGASVKELADAVGLSQAGLLHYFGTKEDLFVEVLRTRDRRDEEAAEPYRGAPLTGFVDVVRGNASVPGLVQLYAQLSIEAADPSHPAHDYFVERYRLFRATMAELLRARRDAGELPADLDAERAAALLAAAADGLQVQWLLEPELDMAAHLEYLVGLLATPGQGSRAAG
ncbi:TetR/AcrR family transcriptional regulator [Agromyces mangrovi Wang et al. 2018]|uniref:TetR/AcrR family transcriptional regulator n=1 Tax=Agromyces mangrovi TaxID=1858653 RepID=UPI00257294D8|nr:TetR/AcrR family transcriptional regulator [Agromyces mangrovi]BDZ64876.1 TetR family transcriptional regulator [Agromyces mangrovi]